MLSLLFLSFTLILVSFLSFLPSYLAIPAFPFSPLPALSALAAAPSLRPAPLPAPNPASQLSSPPTSLYYLMAAALLARQRRAKCKPICARSHLDHAQRHGPWSSRPHRYDASTLIALNTGRPSACHLALPKDTQGPFSCTNAPSPACTPQTHPLHDPRKPDLTTSAASCSTSAPSTSTP